jgi:hypothetical protein
MSEGSWDPPPKKSSGATKWILIGCGVAAVLGVLVCGGVGVIIYFVARGVSGSVDEVFAQALASGDARAAYANADPRFKDVYREEHLADFFRDYPAVTRRDNLTGRSIKTFSRDGVEYVLVLARVQSELDSAPWVFVCTRAADGKLRLLGVDPVLSDAVPDGVRNDMHEMLDEMHRDWDD